MAMFPSLDNFSMLWEPKSGGAFYHPDKSVCHFGSQILIISSRSEAILDCCPLHLIVVSASSSLPLLPHHWRQDNGAAGAKDAAGSATAVPNWSLVLLLAPWLVAMDLLALWLQQHCHCTGNDNNSNNQHRWHLMPPLQNYDMTLLINHTKCINITFYD